MLSPMSGGRGVRFRWLVPAAAVVVVAGSAAWAALARTVWGPVAAVFAAVFGTFAQPAADGWRVRHAHLDLDEMARRLAAVALGRVLDSAVWMRLRRPMPLRVWFGSVDADVAASRPAVTGVDEITWSQEPIHDHVGHVADR